MSSSILHFTIGPIQAFIFQARRTRDLWGGSFILSWLAAVAMNEVIRSGGEIVFPAIKDNPLLAAVRDRPGTKLSLIGRLPTRFKAIVPSDFDPDHSVVQVVRDTYANAAERVWETYLAPFESQGNGTREIWERQIKGFWEFAWVIGEDSGAGSDLRWLDQRKHWCIPASTALEGGDHCTVMHAWQELSGWVRARNADKQKKFWRALRSGVGLLDLRTDERLCAVAFVKRILPKLSRDDKEIFGWKMDVSNWPSTAYMAAVPWIAQAWEEHSSEATDFAKLVQESFNDGASGEKRTDIRLLRGVGTAFRSLDGNAFHDSTLTNEKTTPLREDARREQLLHALKSLQQALSCEASPYYALLLMDGDGLGTMLLTHNEGSVSASLAEFTAQVPGIVADCNGVTVYAGGDDVLAMLPVAWAISAARRLEAAFREVFASHGIEASISAALVFSHFKQALQAVLSEARHQLDDVAKDHNGRSSLAIAVLQGSGKNIEWVTTWENAVACPPQELERLAKSFREDPLFSTRFIYGLNSLFGMLPTDVLGSMPETSAVFNERQLRSLMIADFLNNRERVRSVPVLKIYYVDSLDDLPQIDTASVIIARVGGQLAIRIFSADGRLLADKSENQLTHGVMLRELKGQIINGFDVTHLTATQIEALLGTAIALALPAGSIDRQEAADCIDDLLIVCRRHRRGRVEFELQASGARLVKFLADEMFRP
jgi:CRISPR-associated protein Cmr2